MPGPFKCFRFPEKSIFEKVKSGTVLDTLLIQILLKGINSKAQIT